MAEVYRYQKLISSAARFTSKASGLTSLVVGRDAESLPNLFRYRQLQRSRDDEEVMSLMQFTEHRDFPLLRTFDLLTNRHTLSQNGGFEQPGVAAFGQETIVMLGRHFDQYLQDLKNNFESTKKQEEIRQCRQISRVEKW